MRVVAGASSDGEGCCGDDRCGGQGTRHADSTLWRARLVPALTISCQRRVRRDTVTARLPYRDGVTITADERAALSDLFDELGPDEPTLCEGWTTRDLLAHLLVRERRPDAAGGIIIPLLAKRTKQVMASIAEKPFDDMVEQLRSGPPIWSPFAVPVFGDKGNLVEFFVHHEDVRRAQPSWEPRADDAARDDAMWKVLKMMGRLMYRRSPVGVTLRSAGRADLVVKKA